MTVKVLLVDNHPTVRHGLHALLKEISNIEIVGEVENGDTAIKRAIEQRPDVVIMGLSMRCTDGFEVAGQILKNSPQTKIMGLSLYLDKCNVKRALKIGMSGYLQKNCTAKELRLAIRTIINGRNYFSSKIEPVF